MLFVAAHLVAGLALSLLTGDGLSISGTQTITILPYVIIGSLWRQSYFQTVEAEADGGPAERRRRRRFVRGAIVWVLLAYVVLIITGASYGNGDSSGTPSPSVNPPGNDDRDCSRFAGGGAPSQEGEAD